MGLATDTTTQRLASHARGQPDVRAVIAGATDCSYRRLANHVVQMVDALTVLGIRRGQVVGIEAGDRFLHLLLLACEAMGAATISLSPFDPAPEIDLGRFCDRILAMLTPAGADAGKVFVLTKDWLIQVLRAPVEDDRFDALMQLPAPDSLVRLIKSSGTTGTTGTPKVMGMTYRVQQRTIRNNLLHAAAHIRPRPGYLCCYPFSLRAAHSRALLTLQLGGTIHFAAMEAAAEIVMAGAVNYALFNGWYHTNDLGFQPSPGTLVVIGRTDEMLNVGG